MIHLNACAYYKASDIEGIGYNGWTYNGEGNAYIRCFYFATKTSTSIGKNAKPENDFEYIYMTFAWLMGVCVFALLVGQIRYFIIMATKAQVQEEGSIKIQNIFYANKCFVSRLSIEYFWPKL